LMPPINIFKMFILHFKNLLFNHNFYKTLNYFSSNLWMSLVFVMNWNVTVKFSWNNSQSVPVLFDVLWWAYNANIISSR
jgi:hypothetical protein